MYNHARSDEEWALTHQELKCKVLSKRGEMDEKNIDGLDSWIF